MKTQKAYEHIVDLNTVWKDANHTPQTNKKVLVVKKNGRVICGYLFIDNHTVTVKIEPFHAIASSMSNLYGSAYVADLLPKEQD